MSNGHRRRYDLEQLAAELDSVADKRLPKTFLNPDGRDEATFPVLARVARTVLPHVWKEDPTRALVRLMRAAIERLSEDQPPDLDVTWKEMGTLLYGLRKGLGRKPDGTWNSYNDYVKRLKEEGNFHASERTFGRRTARLREMLAQQILTIEADIAKGALDLEPTTVNTSTPGPRVADTPSTLTTEPEPSVTIANRSQPFRRSLDSYLEKGIDDLANDIRRQLREGQRWRKISDPFPLPVRWSNAPSHFMDHWSKIRRDREQSDPLTLADNLDNVTAMFESIPSGRLVVLGAGGAGKTSLATELVRGLLDPTRRVPTEPVPVIFSIASWNPFKQTFNDWMVEDLVANYRSLGVTPKRRSVLASRIVREGHILPIFDGFDEVSADLREILIREFNTTLSDTSLVLTSRPREFFYAIDSTDMVIAGAAVIQLEELTLDQIAEYLPLTSRKLAGDNPNRTKWHPVLSSMRDSPKETQSTALLEVFSTPLMVSLARAIYSDTTNDPVELLNADRFPNVATLSAYLFDRFVEVSYSRDNNLRTRSTWNSRNAKDWLGILAVELHSRESRSIAWWWINRLLPSQFAGIAFTISLVVIIAIYSPMMALGNWTAAHIAGGFAFLTQGLAHMTAGNPHALGRVRFRKRGEDLLVPSSELLIGCLFMGTAIGVATSPATTNSRVAWPALIGEVCVLVLLAYIYIAATFTHPANLDRALSPARLVRVDRQASLARGLYCTLGISSILIFYGKEPWTTTFWIMITLVFVGTTLSTASGAWLISRLWLTVKKRSAWRTMAFLEDARRRGILRQNGGVYEFRHSLLQDRLAYDWLSRHSRERQGPDILRARANLADQSLTLGNNIAAEAELRTVLDLQRSKLGGGHRDTLQTSYTWARSLQMNGRPTAALDELRSIREEQAHTLALNAALSVKVWYFYAWLLANRGRHKEAAAEFADLLDVLERERGDDDSLIIATREKLGTARRLLAEQDSR